MKVTTTNCSMHVLTPRLSQLMRIVLFIACANMAYSQATNRVYAQKTLIKAQSRNAVKNISGQVTSKQSSARQATTTQPTFDCSSGKSYLFQGDDHADATTQKSNTEVYVLNITSGNSTKAHGQLLTGDHTSINNVGFNVKDNYLWGYLRGTNKLVRIGSDWSVQLVTIDGLSDDIPFNAGDIDEKGIMYLYYGKDNGSPSKIKRVNLTTLTALSDLTLTSNRTIDYMIDIAYNPVDHYLYGVDGSTASNGNNRDENHLYRIDPATGAATDLGNTGITYNQYPFGAAYFDNSGTLYISQNLTGHIYKIKNVSTGAHSAKFLRYGPKTNDNDGARCFNSEIKVNISGTVFDDGNGLVDGTVNGTPVSTIAGNTLYVDLVGTNGKVIATTPLTNGTYSFSGLSPNSSFSLVLTNTAGTVGSNPTGTTLTGNVYNTGENIGSGAGNDGSPDGIIAITLTDEDTDNVNFGLNKIPTADPKTAANQANPGGTNRVTVPTLTGSDLEDGTYNGVSKTNTIVIKSLPTNGKLYYDNMAVTNGQVITNYDPSKLMVDPDDGPISVTFTYSERDAALKDSPAATVTIPFTLAPDLVPIIYARPNNVYGLTPMTVVVDVLELKGVATSGLITVRVTKDPLFSLSFSGSTTSVDGRVVNNAVWSLDDSDPAYYILTTTQVIGAGGTLSFGLSGSLDPSGTSGNVTVSSVIDGGSGGEVKINNNTDADKIDYFQQ